VPASFLPCHGVEVFLNEFGSPFGCRVVLSGNQRQRGGLGILGGKGDNGDVDVLAWKPTGGGSSDSDVVPALYTGDEGL
jgi:hypothetical protein